MAVSFTHIVKAAEPVLSVILSGPLLGMSYIPLVYWSLLPIVAGCALSAMKEVSFAWNGFGNAMLSNLGFVLRNIYSKKYLDAYEKELQITGINMYAIITILSFLIEIPFAVAFEGHRWPEMWAAAAASQGGPTAMIQLVAVGGLFYHLYNQSSYMVLDTGVTPVTFSVANAVKRVAIVLATVAFFRNPVSPLNWIGSGMALAGTYLYSLATTEQKRRETAAAKAALA